MNPNQTIIEEITIIQFGKLNYMGYAVGHGPHLAPDEAAAERDSFSEVVLVGRLREAIRRLSPAIPKFRTLATLCDTLSPKLPSGELSTALFDEGGENI